MNNKLKLGIFVVVGLLIFVAGIFFVGARQNLFGNNIKVVAVFRTVDGLQTGSQVRFSGIDIGTVERIQIKSDSAVLTVLSLEKSSSKFVKEDAVAAISTAGLMGNKIVDIASGTPNVSSISDGDTIQTSSPAGFDEILDDLKATTSSARVIADNIATISKRIEEGQGLIGKLVSDTTQYGEIESIINSFEMASSNVQNISSDIEMLTSNTLQGRGALGRLMADQETARKVEVFVDSLAKTGEISTDVAQNVLLFSRKLNSKKGTIDKILTDSAFAKQIDSTVIEVKRASEEIDQTADKINGSWLLNLFGGNKKKKKQN